MTDATADLLVAFRRGKGEPGWQRRHAESPVPSRWPYGLDGLAESGRRTVTQELDDPGSIRRRLLGLGLDRRRTSVGALDATVALCWDELTVGAMLAGASASRYYCGVVWATDIYEADPDDARARGAAQLVRQMDGVWVTCRPQVDSVRRWLGPHAPPVHFVPLGIDPAFYAQRPYPTEPHVVSVGGDRDRDPHTLFAALELVRAERPDVRCTVQTSSELNPPAGVSTIARLPHVEVANLLASATVVALATKPNGHASGLTVGLESKSVGRPLVACATPGMDEYFHDGQDALLVPPSEPEAMADSILALLADRRRAEAMGLAAAETVRESFTTANLCRGLAEICV